MKKAKFTVATACACLLVGARGSSMADEVYFDTISTRKASRDHGAYFGAFGGGAPSGPSADLRGDYKGLHIDKDDGWFLGAEFGYSFSTPLPAKAFVELEFSYLDTPLNAFGSKSLLQSDIRAFNLLLNGGIQLNLDDRRDEVGDFWASFRPFVGAGIGGAHVRQNNILLEEDGKRVISDRDHKDFSWAYQFFAGIEFALSDTFSIYGEYKRLGYEDFGDGDVSDAKYDLWAIGFKLQY